MYHFVSLGIYNTLLGKLQAEENHPSHTQEPEMRGYPEF